MTYTLFDRTCTTLAALAERHEDGDRREQIVCATLSTLLAAIEYGRTDELWAQLSPIWTQWGVERSQAVQQALADSAQPRPGAGSPLGPARGQGGV